MTSAAVEQDRPYQAEGAQFLADRVTAVLADDMGLGKTYQTIRALEKVGAKRYLIIAPPNAVLHWCEQIDLWSEDLPLAQPLMSGKDFKSCPLGHPDASIVTTYDLITAHYQLLKGEPFDAVIADEFHKLKNPQSKRSRVFWGQVLRAGRRRWFLSGTPMPNGLPSELWPLLYCTGRTKLGFAAFSREFCDGYVFDGKFVPQTPKPSAVATLLEMLKPIMLRRTKKQVLEQMPGVTFTPVYMRAQKLTPVDLEQHAHFIGFTRGEGEGTLEDVLASQRARLAEAMEDGDLRMVDAKLARELATLRRHTGISKVVPFARHLAEGLRTDAWPGGKVVVFAEHREVIEGLKNELRDVHKIKSTIVYGGTPTAKRMNRVKSFQSCYKTQVFIGQTTACAESLDLTAACTVFVLESPWVPGALDQAISRVWRYPQSYPVSVYFVATIGGTDDVVATSIMRKLRGMKKFLRNC